MKIRTKLTIRYTGITAVVLLVFAALIYLSSYKDRESEFFRDLKKEAVTKANLFLSGKVDSKTMQSIYENNRETLDEVEIAVYDTTFTLLYHDAKDIDIVKETNTMISYIIHEKEITFYEKDYQVIGMLYYYKGEPYVITAAAYDGYGYAKLQNTSLVLIILCFAGIFILLPVGYLLSRGALKPVSDMVSKVDNISASSLNQRIPVQHKTDEIGELATTFNTMLDRIEHSFNAQTMFVSNVSHELRTPLAALAAEIELALMKERNIETYQRTLTEALNDTRKLTRLSGGLLDLARASYNANRIGRKEIRLDEVLLDAREIVLKANTTYHIELLFEQEIEDEQMITVIGNEYLLKTACVNLMENNCKFSANHLSNVHISFFEQKSLLRFSDSGIGIPAADMKHLFDPFYRGENKQYAEGNGIGLALVQRIVTLHGGNIRVNSHVGEGTVFTVELPHI